MKISPGTRCAGGIPFITAALRSGVGVAVEDLKDLSVVLRDLFAVFGVVGLEVGLLVLDQALKPV